MVRNIKSQYIALDKQNKIALGDAIGCLKELADNSVDFIITDPPYNLGLFMKKRGTNMDKLRNGHFAASGWDDLILKIGQRKWINYFQNAIEF